MNEYAGFKVGDKVKTDFGNGVVCHISGGIDYCHVRTEKHGVIFARVENLQKLPNYAVGDVVRLGDPKTNQNKIVTVRAVEDGCLYSFHEEGLGLFSEHFISPFDGFRVGDTVWTLKRGKGRIVDTTVFCIDPKRPFIVRFDGEKKDRCPKIEYLIPTESAYKKAVIDDAFSEYFEEWDKLLAESEKTKISLKGTGKVYQCPPVGIISESIPCPKIFGVFNVGDKVMYRGNKCVVVQKVTLGHMQWGPTYSVNSGDCRWDKVKHNDLKPWEPKFKVGDEVNYNGGKYVVQTIYTNSPTRDYHIHGFPFSFNVKEYDLTPWVDVKPKFKVGDVVFYPSSCGVSKWTIDMELTSIPWDYLLKGFDKDDTHHICVKSSEIRLWKDTKLTHCLQSGSDKWSDGGNSNWPQSSYKEIKYLGNICGHDTFLVTTSGESKALFRGIKGDDIQ